MQQPLEVAQTPWQAGSFGGSTQELLFGSMYEDSSIELTAFARARRVFCIASAGCTARALSAAGHDVTAVDINPHQIEYCRARASGGPVCEGAAERLLSRGRLLFPLLGWTERRLRSFLSMCDPTQQLDYWRRILDGPRWRLTIGAIFAPSVMRLAYATPFVAALPSRFGTCVRARLERTWSRHANCSNAYAWRLLLGETPSLAQSRAPAIQLICADAASYLEASHPASFDAFTLSNVTDGAPPHYIQRLYRAVKHAAAPEALVVRRSFAEPGVSVGSNNAANDRSLLWGTVNVSQAAHLCSTF